MENSRRWPFYVSVLLGSGLLVYFAGRSKEAKAASSGGSSFPPPKNAFPEEWPYDFLTEAIRRTSRITGDNPTNLAAWAFPLVYRESRGNRFAESTTGEYGLFQLRPESTDVTAEELYEPSVNFAEAMAYRHRLRNYFQDPSKMRVIDVIRGWSYPALAKDVSEENSKSRQIRERIQEILGYFGYPPDYVYLPAFSAGYHWDDSTKESIRSALASIPVV